MILAIDKVLEYEALLKNKLKCFACVAFTFHQPVGNFAGCGEMGLLIFREGGRCVMRDEFHSCQRQRG
jgi:hypothetical protein